MLLQSVILSPLSFLLLLTLTLLLLTVITKKTVEGTQFNTFLLYKQYLVNNTSTKMLFLSSHVITISDVITVITSGPVDTEILLG